MLLMVSIVGREDSESLDVTAHVLIHPSGVKMAVVDVSVKATTPFGCVVVCENFRHVFRLDRVTMRNPD